MRRKACSQTPDSRSASQAKVGTESQRLEDVGATANATVNSNRYLALCNRNDLAKNIEGGGNTIELATTVVRDDDSVEAVSNS
jgi:hypothetical protein